LFAISVHDCGQNKQYVQEVYLVVLAILCYSQMRAHTVLSFVACESF